MVEILDSTLREGEQTPYVNFMVDEKIEIARLLDQVGVEMIEAGDPSCIAQCMQAIKKIASLRPECRDRCPFAWQPASGIDKAKDCGADRVAIFYATSKSTWKPRLIKAQEEAVADHQRCTSAMPASLGSESSLYP